MKRQKLIVVTMAIVLMALFAETSFAQSLLSSLRLPGSTARGISLGYRENVFYNNYGDVGNNSSTSNVYISIPLPRRQTLTVTKLIAKIYYRDNNSAASIRCRIYNPNTHHTAQKYSSYVYSQNGYGTMQATLSDPYSLTASTLYCLIPPRQNNVMSFITQVDFSEEISDTDPNDPLPPGPGPEPPPPDM